MIISLNEAKAQGLKQYFTGKPCPKQHIAPRSTSNSSCLECKRLEARKRYHTQPHVRDLAKNYNWESKYGISRKQYQELLHNQKGVCATCFQICSTGRMLAVDHDHSTGKVRGLLCTNCNHVLGKVKDNPNILRAMIRYLS